jgi:hypothetical protein
MAHRLRVSSRWLKGEAEAGRVPCLKAEKQLLFNAAAVESALSAAAAQGHQSAAIDGASL